MMTEHNSFKLPDYARYAHEVVGSFYIEVWIEDNTRWLRIDVLKDLVGNFGPYSVRIFVAGEHGGPWSEMEEYPWWTGDSPEDVVEKCLAGLADRAEIVRGVETREAIPETPGGPPGPTSQRH
jgi:hypothetical protein